MQNQALEQTRDSVLRYGEPIGRELLNFYVRQREAQNQGLATPRTVGVPSLGMSRKHDAAYQFLMLHHSALQQSHAMNVNVDLCIATCFAIAIVVGFVVFLWRMSHGVVPQNRGGGCLLFLGSALAVLLTIPYGFSPSPIAHRYEGFYFAVAVILCLTGVISGLLAKQRQRSEPKRDRDPSGPVK